jgi:hypothetical protein
MKSDHTEVVAKIEATLRAEANRRIKWVIGIFLPIWCATWGTMFWLLSAR